MASPYLPMLVGSASTPPGGDGWVHEAKLDGWRAVIQVARGHARMWSRTGREWTDRLPELDALAVLGDVVLDAEIVVVSPDGRADFDLLAARLNGRRGTPPATLYVFDVLAYADTDLTDRPWTERRKWLDDLNLAEATGGMARATLWSSDGAALHRATAELGLEGTVSKRLNSRYRPGQRSRSWLKAKHRRTGVFQVAGWRPTTTSGLGGLILTEADRFVGIATLALPSEQRAALVDLLFRYGQQQPAGGVMIPAGSITATASFTSRTPTYARLREATVTAVGPA